MIPFVAPALSDADLLCRARRGERAAFAQLYGRHEAAVFRFAWTLTGDEAGAADVTQDTFMALLRDASRFDAARGSLGAYLCGIARHCAAHRFDARTAVVDPSTLEVLLGNADVGLGDPPADAIERRRALDRLYAAIHALPAHYRDVLVLVELQELKYAEVAVICGLELGTVRSRLSRARALLADTLRGPMP